jgi:drug/metabolite transporter (DMT)-like permease
MDKQSIRSYALLSGAALVWGFAFVAQRKGMEFSGPLSFNGLRFLLGTLTLLPLLLLYKPKKGLKKALTDKRLLLAGIMAGTALFFAASFQQIGIIYTTAGNAGFITGFYIILVPVFALLRGRHTAYQTWLGALAALAGLYLLSIRGSDNLLMRQGDVLVLLSAFFWAAHIVILSYVAPRHDFRLLAIIQYSFTALLSLMLAAVAEPFPLALFSQPVNLLPLLYAGIVSVGIGFTLQVSGQRHARADLSGMILSTEAVFAALGGYLILHETMGTEALTGSALMLAGIILAQSGDSRP